MLTRLAHKRAFSWAWCVLLLVIGVIAQVHA